MELLDSLREDPPTSPECRACETSCIGSYAILPPFPHPLFWAANCQSRHPSGLLAAAPAHKPVNTSSGHWANSWSRAWALMYLNLWPTNLPAQPAQQPNLLVKSTIAQPASLGQDRQPFCRAHKCSANHANFLASQRASSATSAACISPLVAPTAAPLSTLTFWPASPPAQQPANPRLDPQFPSGAHSCAANQAK